MWVIIEYNGFTVMGLVTEDDDSGEFITFETEVEALRYAKDNCAFEYKVVQLW